MTAARRGRTAIRRTRARLDTFDHTLIEWRWNLAPLTARDASADVGDLRDALDFAHPDASVPSLPLPLPPVPHFCPRATSRHRRSKGSRRSSSAADRIATAGAMAP